MKPSQILKQAFALIEKPGTRTTGVFARDAAGNPVNVMADSASCWCSVGAVKRVVGESGHADGPFDALLCLSLGASKVNLGDGTIEINDQGNDDQVRAMFVFGIQAAERVEDRMLQPA